MVDTIALCSDAGTRCVHLVLRGPEKRLAPSPPGSSALTAPALPPAGAVLIPTSVNWKFVHIECGGSTTSFGVWDTVVPRTYGGGGDGQAHGWGRSSTFGGDSR